MIARIGKLAGWVAPMVVVCNAALAEDKADAYPERPIRIIISVAPGTGADFVARMTACVSPNRGAIHCSLLDGRRT